MPPSALLRLGVYIAPYGPDGGEKGWESPPPSGTPRALSGARFVYPGLRLPRGDYVQHEANKSQHPVRDMCRADPTDVDIYDPSRIWRVSSRLPQVRNSSAEIRASASPNRTRPGTGSSRSIAAARSASS